jgi:hypothetical protein
MMRAEGITKSYGRFRALSDVSFSVGSESFEKSASRTFASLLRLLGRSVQVF